MKKYIFKEFDDNGATIQHHESNTLSQLSKDTNITVSSLYRIKENKTQGNKKGKYSKCHIDVLHHETLDEILGEIYNE